MTLSDILNRQPYMNQLLAKDLPIPTIVELRRGLMPEYDELLKAFIEKRDEAVKELFGVKRLLELSDEDKKLLEDALTEHLELEYETQAPLLQVEKLGDVAISNELLSALEGYVIQNIT